VIGIVETDKVTMEIRAKQSGIFVEALVAAGSEVSVGADIYKIDTSSKEVPVNSEATIPNPPPPKPAAAPVKRIEVAVPAMGDSITQGVLASWLVKTGGHVKVDDVVASIETDKVTVEVRAPAAGIIGETFAEEGDEVFVGNQLFVINEGGSAAPVAAPAKPAEVKSATSTPAPKDSAATKAVAPAPAAAAAKPEPTAVPAKAKSENKSVDSFQGDRSETRVKMTRMRIRIAQRLKESQNVAAMLTTFQEVDMQELMDMRTKYASSMSVAF
jgi:2-oxoglutarate dehydrogenase E2 component (dihydrolipoamide succinyltransferase)